MTIELFPAVNASLNALSSVFLLLGYRFIRRKEEARHRAMMIAAFATSTLFLASYLTYHFSTHLITRFQGEGIARAVYFAVLGSHSVLATVVPVLAVITLALGLRRRTDRHRRIARWTFPLWLYVSVTGVIIYVMLYHLYAA
jgi:uncharacterized membrane protein YozB (DUF420 family)